MLYLEDYLEMIEHLPIELRDRYNWFMLRSELCICYKKICTVH